MGTLPVKVDERDFEYVPNIALSPSENNFRKRTVLNRAGLPAQVSTDPASVGPRLTAMEAPANHVTSDKSDLF